MKTQTAVIILVLGSPLIYLMGWFFAYSIDNFIVKKKELRNSGGKKNEYQR